MADYLDQGDTEWLHPVGLKQLASRFGRLKVDDQVFALKTMGAKKNEIKACTNSKQRTALYRKLITNHEKYKHKTKTTGNPSGVKGSERTDQ